MHSDTDYNTHCGRPHVWLDVTMLLTWKGKANGIPRMLSSILACLRLREDVALRLCAYRGFLGGFVEVQHESIPERFRFIDTASAPLKAVQRLQTLRNAATKVLKKLEVILPYRVSRFARSFLQNNLILRILKTYWTQPWARGRVAPFAPGDTLLSIGTSWSLPRYLQYVSSLKTRNQVQFVPVAFDIIPCKCPQFVPREFPEVFGAWTESLLRAGDTIVTISQSARADLLEYARERTIAAPPVKVIRLGDELPASISQRKPREITEEVKARGFAVCVSTIDARKNHILLYQVWKSLIAELGDQTPYLVFAGYLAFHADYLMHYFKNDPAVRDKLIIVLAADDAEINWLYAHCQFSLFPSHYEGWGLPVAESLARGKICIASNSSSIPEIGGNLVDYHEPPDYQACKALVKRYVTDPHCRQHREAQIRTQYQPTTWKQCTESLLAFVEKSATVTTRTAA